MGRADWVGRQGPRSREMMAWMLWCGCGMQHSGYPRHRLSEHSKPSPPAGKLMHGWPQWSNLPDPCTVIQHPPPSSPLSHCKVAELRQQVRLLQTLGYGESAGAEGLDGVTAALAERSRRLEHELTLARLAATQAQSGCCLCLFGGVGRLLGGAC